jgi:hypothetical protein
MSYTPTLRGANGDLASLLDEGLNSQSPAWKLLTSQADSVNPFEKIEYDDLSSINFEHEFDEIEAVDSKGGNEGVSLWALVLFALIINRRGSSAPVEVKVEALFDTIFGRQTYLQQAWRPKPYQWIHWHHPDDHLILPGCKRSPVGFHCWWNQICSSYRRATLFCGYKQARRE